MKEISDDVGGPSNGAFKSTAKGVIERQDKAQNDLLKLGGNIDPKKEGKFLDKAHICLKPTDIENLYPVQKEVNMMVRRNQDEYP